MAITKVISKPHSLYDQYRFKEKIVQILIDIGMQFCEIYGIISFGSLGRGNLHYYSDLDIIILSKSESVINIRQSIEDNLKEFIKFKNEYDNKVIYYLNRSLQLNIKLEIYFTDELNKYQRYLIGSNLTKDDISRMILFDRNGKLASLLRDLLRPEGIKKYPDLYNVKYHMSRFIEAFGNGSTCMVRGDPYGYYFQFNICFHHLIVLESYLAGNKDFLYLPRYPFNRFYDLEKKEFYKQNVPSLNMNLANDIRENYKNRFISLLKEFSRKKIEYYNIEKTRLFLEELIRNSFFWNFRDISYIDNQKIRPGQIFRSSSLSRCSGKKELDELIKKYKIQTIIDLRKPSEIQRLPYRQDFIRNINYCNIPVGLKTEQKCITYTYLTPNSHDAFYEIFLKCYRPEIKKIFTTLLLDKIPVIIHCHAGRDRTGMVIAMILRLLDIPDELIVEDYLVSGTNTTGKAIKVFLRVLDDFGGISQYLFDLGFNKNEINMLKNKFGV